MSRRMKRASAILAILGLACAVLWVNRVDVALGVLGFLAKQRSPVRPNQDITWATGTDPQGRPPGERPPNVVLVLADDLGWNDLTFGGGGIADGTVPRPKIDSIAAEGVNFSNGYAASATCAPSPLRQRPQALHPRQRPHDDTAFTRKDPT